jgi:hypothetical protein
MRDEHEWFEEAVRRALGRRAGRSALRASDAEREAIGAALRDAHAEGRLTSDEFEERVTRCYRAKTLGELDRLVRDLPPPPVPRAVRRRPWFLVPLLAVLLVASLVSHDHGAIVLLLALVVVLWLAIGRRRGDAARVTRRLP